VSGFTTEVRVALDGARAVAGEFIGTEHLLITLAQSPGVASAVLAQAGLSLARLEAVIPASPGGQTDRVLPFSPGAKHAIELAAGEAEAHGNEDIGTAHLLLGLLGDEEANAATKAVEDAGFDRTQVRRAVDEALASGSADND